VVAEVLGRDVVGGDVVELSVVPAGTADDVAAAVGLMAWAAVVRSSGFTLPSSATTS
jgi:diacylglycerol kinase family enzyme